MKVAQISYANQRIDAKLFRTEHSHLPGGDPVANKLFFAATVTGGLSKKATCLRGRVAVWPRGRSAKIIEPF